MYRRNAYIETLNGSGIVLIAYTPAAESRHRGAFHESCALIFIHLDCSSGFANPAVFPHYYLFAWGRSALPLLQILFSFQFFCRSM
jgi:hypothetical protein